MAREHKQAVQQLEVATSELSSTICELQSKQVATAEVEAKLSASKQELSRLEQSVHAEQDTAQRASAEAHSQLAELQAELDANLLQLERQRHINQQDDKTSHRTHADASAQSDRSEEEAHTNGCAQDVGASRVVAALHSSPQASWWHALVT